MEEETLRKMAIEQFLRGISPVSIYREMGKSKKWFFKWLNRYRSGDLDWCQDHPRVPRSHPRQTQPDIRELLVTIRKQLEIHPFAQIGASAIKWECEKLGIIPPSDSTINRLIKKKGLVKKKLIHFQRGGIPLFHRSAGFQLYPSGRPPRSTIPQRGRAFLFAEYHGSLQPSGFSSSATWKRRPNGCTGLDQLLEDHGNTRLSPGRQRTLFPGKQPVPSFFWDYHQTLPLVGYRAGFYSNRRTVA